MCIRDRDDTFTLWQLPSQVNTIGNSYVIRTDDGQIIVMDGGMKEEEGYLREMCIRDRDYIASVLEEQGIRLRFTNTRSEALLTLRIDKKVSKNPEGYRLTVSPKKGVTALAPTANGLLHALQTLRQIVSLEGRCV